MTECSTCITSKVTTFLLSRTLSFISPVFTPCPFGRNLKFWKQLFHATSTSISYDCQGVPFPHHARLTSMSSIKRSVFILALRMFASLLVPPTCKRFQRSRCLHTIERLKKSRTTSRSLTSASGTVLVSYVVFPESSARRTPVFSSLRDPFRGRPRWSPRVGAMSPSGQCRWHEPMRHDLEASATPTTRTSSICDSHSWHSRITNDVVRGFRYQWRRK